jgi:hypothetical protein
MSNDEPVQSPSNSKYEKHVKTDKHQTGGCKPGDICQRTEKDRSDERFNYGAGGIGEASP